MNIIHEIATLREKLAPLRNQKIVFVPTMGNLHEGHLELVKKAKSFSPHVVVSIFVNPLQFAPNEDFATYPRTLKEDIAKLAKMNVPLVFVPQTEEIYPDLDSSTQVSVPKISDDLCGAFRPPFFYGICTVVAKFFNIVQPDIAIFGEKDFQQLHIIRKMVSDLCFQIAIESVPTVREADGLAMSSRNGYLTSSERSIAKEVVATLQTIQKALLRGESDHHSLTQQAIDDLQAKDFKVDYLTIRSKVSLTPPEVHEKDLVILIAAWLGKTRLIDNLIVKLD